ncbi:MAG: CDP-alcohol phosphatidyltransferase family protein [Calditrichia bacterium]
MNHYYRKSVIPKSVEEGFIKLIDPLVNFFVKLDVHPNTFTVWGLILSLVGAGFLAAGHIHLGGLFILLGGICDVFDGKIARKSNKVSKFGALLDSSLDRYAEIFMFLGAAIYLVRLDYFLTSVMIFIALGGSSMVSYVRARAEGLGFDCKVGLMQRPERVVLMGVAALFHHYLLIGAVWIIAVLANYTAYQRIKYVYDKSKEMNSDDSIN